METTSKKAKWGTYSLSFMAKILRLPVLLGLGRGKLKDIILEHWKKTYGEDVDIVVRGVKYRLNIQDNITDARLLVSSQVYDKTEIEVLRRSCKGGTFVDIGANIGYYAIVMAVGGANKVIAIEPNPPALERLRFNIGLNNLNDIVTVVPCGIGESGEFSLSQTGGLGGASLVIPEDDQGSITIKTRPLLDVLNEHGIRQIAGMKIDIEGFEDRALMPFFKTAPQTMWPRCIVMEDCYQQYWQSDIKAYLLQSGYRQSGKTRGNVILELTTAS